MFKWSLEKSTVEFNRESAQGEAATFSETQGRHTAF